MLSSLMLIHSRSKYLYHRFNNNEPNFSKYSFEMEIVLFLAPKQAIQQYIDFMCGLWVAQKPVGSIHL